MRTNARTSRKVTRASQLGFTLTELMSSLTAGLFIASAVVSISRSASESFHEEARTLTAQNGARQAMEQLSLDLMRAGYMSTGNIQADPLIAKPPGALMNDLIPGQYLGLRRLAGVRLFVGGSKAATDPQSTFAGLNPDAIELGGNFTTADQYAVREIAPTVDGCQRVWLQADSPAMWRLISTTAGLDATLLINAFKPGPTAGTRQFMVRIQDSTGRYQYAPTCGTAGAVGISGGFPYVDVAQNSLSVGVLTGAQAGTTGGSAGYGSGMLINPIQIVRWAITNAPPANSVAAMTPTSDPSKFYLVRSMVDALGAVDPGSTQVVTEYAVDLKFALTVETGDSTATNTAHSIFPFEDSANALWSYDVSGSAPSSTGPQRIRSVRVRFATRAPLPDREAAIPVTPTGPEGQRFMLRYCTGSAVEKCTDGSRSHARVRTLTNEIALSNQSRLFY